MLYGHYTTSSLISSCNLHNVMAQSSIYLCGHLHNIHGLAPSNSIWTRHESGLLEVELADWNKNHKFVIYFISYSLFTVI